MSLSSYIVPRGKRGILQLRLPVPRPLWNKVGKRSYRTSLGTTDRKLAERKAIPILSEWEAEFEKLLSPPKQFAAGDAAEVALRRVYRPLMKRFSEMSALALDGPDANKIVEAAQARLTRHVLGKNSGKLDLSKLADLLINEESLNITKGSLEYAEFVETLSDITIDAAENHAQVVTGTLDPTPKTPLGKRAYDGKSLSAKSGETIEELFEQYAKIRIAEGRKRDDGIAQDRMVVNRFAEYVGKVRSVSSVSVDEARGFRDTLSLLPKGYAKRKDYRGLSIQQVVEKADRDGAVRMSDITRDRYISTVSPFFDWLVSEGRDGIQVNPFNGLHQKTLKGSNPRPSLSLSQQQDIFSSPLFVGFEADRKEHLLGDERANDWRFWLPLIGMFSGARITEVAQLNIDNVVCLPVTDIKPGSKQQGTAYFFEFKEDRRTGQQTKSKKSRIVPLHSKLIAIGFMAYVTRQMARSKQDGNHQLFPELKLKGARSKLGDVPSRFWRDYLADIGIKNGADGIGAHSFRHTLADRLRTAGFLDAQFGTLILGHSDKSITGGYGAMQQGTAAMRYAMLEAVTFDDLDLSKLHTRKTQTP